MENIMANLDDISSKSRYYQIIFLQQPDQFSLFEGGQEAFFEASTEEQFSFLEQWHQDSLSHYDYREGDSGAGTTDDMTLIVRDGVTYILTVNYRHDYAGLQIRA